MTKKNAVVDKEFCVACGACMKVCPKNAISVFCGKYAVTAENLCIGCGICEKICPAGVIDIMEARTL
ncbi:MAG: 4Fe-4S binding protein [Clostridia bacterium]|jgi:NAD-dependent dihydropyrimidine dehydrogenase PreA subunit|nr:4Fe-4S binding protein [Clostridia bacterium]